MAALPFPPSESDASPCRRRPPAAYPRCTLTKVVAVAAAAAAAVVAAAAFAATPTAALLSRSAFLASLPSPPRSRGDTHGGPGATLPTEALPDASSPAGRPASVIVLHGSSSSGEQTLGILRAVLLLTPRLRSYTHFIAPTAVRPDGTTGSWYVSRRNSSAPGGRTFDDVTLDAAAARVEAILANEAARGIPRSRTALIGFSQGGGLALEVARRLAVAPAGRGRPLAGTVVGAGFVADVGRWAGLTSGSGDVLMIHGEEDTVVPLAAARESAAVLRRAGFDVTLEVLPGEGHLITSPVAVGQALSFLTRVLPP
ncbi:hypothetical protein MMPV_006318 [Pyropia vietnamensis]